MTAPALCQSHPEAAAKLGLFAIFAACQANKARDAAARQAKAEARLALGGLWWREESNVKLSHEEGGKEQQ